MRTRCRRGRRGEDGDGQRREEEGKWFLRGEEERKRRKGKEMKWVVKIIPKI